MQFRFKIQQYQADAAKAVTDVFVGQPNAGVAAYLRDLGLKRTHLGMESLLDDQAEMSLGYGNADIALTASKLLDNVRKVQRANRIQESSALASGPGAVSLDVEMETGTGKTYVYTKTMFELNRLYGWSKFIVVVPSVAIREGVFKSLSTTEQHFFEQYGKAIRFFVYNSARLNELDAYSQSADICCMVINMQAFNTSMKEGGRSKEARIIFTERDEFGSRRPIDVIAANRPIVIMDEPQKMGGKATQAGIERFRPLFTLNYSATHKIKHDCVYVLDALDAFNQRLVKRIEVKGFELKNVLGTDGYLYLQDIEVYRDRAPEAVIEYQRLNASGSVSKRAGTFREGDDIYTESLELEAYRDGFTVAEVVPDQDGFLGYVRLLNGIVLGRGEVCGDSSERDIRRVQIRETIKSHLQKEEVLFGRGIKCLSLFFIDEVAKYRTYGEDGEPALGEYGRVFAEEYGRAVRHVLDEQLELVPGYHDYLRGIDVETTHNGYFSVDKSGRSVDKVNKSGRAGSLTKRDMVEGADDQSAYDLILKDKERLLSFDEPTRFIFSHSALREGWDNPNVFQICTLKQSGSETSKRQEVGRGMRLCVNQDGERQDVEVLGETEVQQVNMLTVVASESYKDFVGALQSDIAADLRERPKRVTEDLFRGLTVQIDTETSYTFTAEDAHDIMWALTVNRLVDREGMPTEAFREHRLEGIGDGDLNELLDGLQDQIAAVVASVYDAHALDDYVSNGLAGKVSSNPLNDNFSRAEFQKLWNMINAKHSYTVSFDDEELRRKAIEHIDDELVVGQATYTVTTGVQRERQTREALGNRDTFERNRRETHAMMGDTTSVTYDLLGEVAQAATITRRSAAHILAGISPHKFALFCQNPEEFIAKAGKLIREAKASMIVDHITYHRLEDRYDSDIFTERMPENVARALQPQKSIQDYVFWDSDGERDFANDLEAAPEVQVFAKLPRAFQIPTPVGNYAPDWAIAFEEGSVRHVFFVAETKGSMSSLDLRPIEKAKIRCARKVFNELSTDDVRYHEVTGYQMMKDVINGME
ncbi:MAG: DEAD/DEAH box helicase family protein [Coriobacteriales bacterium]|nr:DEAD/DEAH box helicase family protein [Coriobacteriales bacterium]